MRVTSCKLRARACIIQKFEKMASKCQDMLPVSSSSTSASSGCGRINSPVACESSSSDHRLSESSSVISILPKPVQRRARGWYILILVFARSVRHVIIVVDAGTKANAGGQVSK